MNLYPALESDWSTDSISSSLTPLQSTVSLLLIHSVSVSVCSQAPVVAAKGPGKGPAKGSSKGKGKSPAAEQA